MTFALLALFCLLPFVMSHSHDLKPMSSKSLLEEREHIGHHMKEVTDLNQMNEAELRFLYFKMHDSDQNNKLDGCELVKSLLHWHVEKHKAMNTDSHGTTHVFRNDELTVMIDPILATDDKNFDGFIDYPEFVAAQVSRGF